MEITVKVGQKFVQYTPTEKCFFVIHSVQGEKLEFINTQYPQCPFPVRLDELSSWLQTGTLIPWYSPPDITLRLIRKEPKCP